MSHNSVELVPAEDLEMAVSIANLNTARYRLLRDAIQSHLDTLGYDGREGLADATCRSRGDQAMTEQTNPSRSVDQHVALLIELPSIYTADLKDLSEYRDDFETESDWLLNCVRVEGPVRLRVEVAGEKDSEVIEVWGHIREAELVEPSRGYNANGHLTWEQLEEHGKHRLLRDERACEWCMADSESLLDGWEDDDA